MRTDTQEFYRKATVPRDVAIRQFFAKNPNADLVGFELRGEQYVATVRVAEFPPKSDEDTGEETEVPSEDAPESEPEDSGEESAPAEGPPSDDGGPEGVEPKKLSPEEETVHLLQQILDALQGGGGLGPAPDLGAGGPEDLVLPDVGAPPAGGGLPAPGKAPLPPPVKPKSPMGVGAFAHIVAAHKSFTFERREASTVNNATLVNEAVKLAPGFRVSKIDRRTKKNENTAILHMERQA